MRDVSASALPPVDSPHTGITLRRVSLELRVAPDTSEDLVARLEQARRPTHALRDADGSEWLVVEMSYSYVNEQPHVFTVVLKEVERLQADRLELPGLVVQPTYYYEEPNVDDGVIIEAEVELAGAEREKLDSLLWAAGLDADEYFSVVRSGVSAEALSMRWGRCLWKDLGTDARAYLLVLISARDDERGPGLAEPQLSNTSRIALEARELFEGLVDELSARGVLDNAGAQAIRDKAGRTWAARQFDLSRVSDFSAYRTIPE